MQFKLALEAHVRSNKHNDTLNDKYDVNNNQCENGVENNNEHENDASGDCTDVKEAKQ